MMCPGWCDQQDRQHVRHECTPFTVIGQGWTRNEATSIQLVIHGLDDTDAQPMIALVTPDNEQVDATLSWADAHGLATAIIEQNRTFARLQLGY